MAMKYSTASQLKSELKSGLSQKKLSVEDRISKGKKLIEEYVPQLEKTNPEKAQKYKDEVQLLIDTLKDISLSSTGKSCDNEINDSDKEPLKEEPQVKGPEETMEFNHKDKTPEYEEVLKEVANLKCKLELQAEYTTDQCHKRAALKTENDDLKRKIKDLRWELQNLAINPTGSKTFDDQYQQLKTARYHLAEAADRQDWLWKENQELKKGDVGTLKERILELWTERGEAWAERNELSAKSREQQEKIEELQAKVNQLQKANGSDGD